MIRESQHVKTTPLPETIITIALLSLLIGISIPTNAYADTTNPSPASNTSTYQFYDQKTRDQQITINKIWNDGLTNNTRALNTNAASTYENYLNISIQTSTPQTTLRTYSIAYDANGGTYGVDNDGNAITTNTITYNAKNQPTNGTPATPERNDGYAFAGWSTNKAATSVDTRITLTNTITDKRMNARTDGSTTKLYAVWKDSHIYYAVMAYGIGVDKDTNWNTMGITFGPALGYPEFSPYNGTYNPETTSVQSFTKSHSVSGDATVISENEPACMDTLHSVITGTDAGTDTAGNAYRCLHYDNWATIIYWNEHDPHVYDKCIPNHCSKTVIITPSAGAIASGTLTTSISDSERGLVGDGQSYIVASEWDYSGYNNYEHYAASLVRTKLVGADSHTKLDDNHAGVDALTRYAADSSLLACFPVGLRGAIGEKALSAVSAANSRYDVTSNDGVADKLWLFSRNEMLDKVYPSAGFKNEYAYDTKRANNNVYYSSGKWWLRSPDVQYVWYVESYGYCNNRYYASANYKVAPGFTLP